MSAKTHEPAISPSRQSFSLSSGSEDSWTHGGLPWAFWQEAGKFIYIFGEAYDDGNAAPYLGSCPIKIGVTKDPASRLSGLRQKTPHGTWYDILWMENSADLTEKSLHELLNPWRCGFEREWFSLPSQVEEWLFEGFNDSWQAISKQDRRCGETVRSICTCIIPTYYPSEWLHKRVKEIDPGNDGHGGHRSAPKVL
jgi:hypothetical protein